MAQEGRRNRMGPLWITGKMRSKRDENGPADCTMAELEQHYVDSSGYNEADSFMNTKKSIIQYLGQTYGGDVRVIIETWRIFIALVLNDPPDYQVGEYDDVGIIQRTAT